MADISIDDLIAERDQLNTVIAFLQRRAPMPTITEADMPQRRRRASGGSATAEAPEKSIGEARAARREAVLATLKTAGQPMSARDLTKILIENGFAKGPMGLGALYNNMAIRKEIKKTRNGDYAPID